MAKEVYHTPYVSVLHEESLSLLTIFWKRQISLEERKTGFLWALEYSNSHQVRNWLIDDAEIFLITPAEKEWITYTWTKLVAGSCIQKIAVVTKVELPALESNARFTEDAQKQYAASGHTRHEVFTDYQMALAWFGEEA
ncbi:MAG: hypothetical protein ACO1NZ_00390 [Adhaeribacter sp.]